MIRPFQRMLRCVASALAVVYVWWNVSWLCRRAAPPSLMIALTGLPAPTTGVTRALRALLDGRIADSLRWNPMSLPIMLLFVASIGLLAWQTTRGRRLALPRGIGLAWGVILSVAWALKLISGPRFW